MSHRIRRSFILILVLAAAGAAIWYATRPKPIPVALKTVDRGRVESTVANTRAGTVKACRRAKLAPAIGGQIERLPVKEGDQVKKGQILLELWNDDLRASLLLAKRQADASAARATQACVAADVAAKDAKRSTDLRKRGLTSEEAADTAVGDAESKRAACKAARVEVQVSQAQVEVAQANLERTRLRAPFDGTVAEVNGEVGEFATPSPVGIPTLPAVDLMDLSCIYVTAPIDEVDAPDIRAGMPARISLDAFPNRHFEGRVRRVAPYVKDVEKQARTVDIDVDFVHAKEAAQMLPGYSADAEVILGAKDNVVRVPTEAVREGNKVLVYDPKDGTLSERSIKTGLSNWVYTEVISGLKPGDQVVTSVDREGVKAGAHVVPENKSGGAGAS